MERELCGSSSFCLRASFGFAVRPVLFFLISFFFLRVINVLPSAEVGDAWRTQDNHCSLDDYRAVSEVTYACDACAV